MDSSQLETTPIRSLGFSEGDFRKFYLANLHLAKGPTIGASECVPPCLVEHLMRKKKDEAIGVKYQVGDEITNMEGALHTLVVPVVEALMQGDYIYNGSHQVPCFDSEDGFLRGRRVLLSCLVQPDFEYKSVLWQLIHQEPEALVGEPLPPHFEVPNAHAKADPEFRERYDAMLKRHIVHHFIGTMPVGPQLCVPLLAKLVAAQIDCEFTVLNELAPEGYIYTWDPPAIFAQTFDSFVLNRLWAQAVCKQFTSDECKCRLVAFNDYRDTTTLPFLKSENVPCTSKSKLYSGSQIDASLLKGYALVIHNNSDAFGQNIETEAAYGSLDGAIGSGSSGSACVERSRHDLCSCVRYCQC